MQRKGRVINGKIMVTSPSLNSSLLTAAHEDYALDPHIIHYNITVK